MCGISCIDKSSYTDCVVSVLLISHLTLLEEWVQIPEHGVMYSMQPYIWSCLSVTVASLVIVTVLYLKNNIESGIKHRKHIAHFLDLLHFMWCFLSFWSLFYLKIRYILYIYSASCIRSCSPAILHASDIPPTSTDPHISATITPRNIKPAWKQSVHNTAFIPP